MKYPRYLMQIALPFIADLNCVIASCGFDDTSSTGLFSYTFQAPSAPTIATELSSSFIQHKYDIEVSHITSGYWYNSAAVGLVRVDEAYEGATAYSLFNYTDVDASGGVKNRLWSIEGSLGSKPTCFNDYVTAPGFPLITADLLISSNATYGGSVADPWVGQVDSWNFLYGGNIPVIAYIQNKTIAAGYDFWSDYRRTKVVTRFYNIRIGSINSTLFSGFPC